MNKSFLFSLCLVVASLFVSHNVLAEEVSYTFSSDLKRSFPSLHVQTSVGTIDAPVAERRLGFPNEATNWFNANPIVNGGFTFDTLELWFSGTDFSVYRNGHFFIDVTDPLTGPETLAADPTEAFVRNNGFSGDSISVPWDFGSITSGVVSVSVATPVTVVVDLLFDSTFTSNFPASQLPAIPQLFVRLTQPSEFEFQHMGFSLRDSSGNALSSTEFPIDLQLFVFDSASFNLQLVGTVAIEVNAADYADPADFLTAQTWVQSNISSVELVAVSNYEINSLSNGGTFVANFGAATNAITRGGGEFPNVEDSFSAAINDASDFDVLSLAFCTCSGMSVGRAETNFPAPLPDGTASIPGLSVGAFSTSSWAKDYVNDGASHGVAFRTYQYQGDVPMTITVQSTVDGSPYGSRPFGEAYVEVRVVDGVAFNNVLPTSPDSYENFFFGIPNKNTEQARPIDLYNRHPGASFSYGTLVKKTKSFKYLTERVTENMSVSFNVLPQQYFTVFFDIATYSRYGSTSRFLSSLSSDPEFIVDVNGEPLRNVVAIGGADALPSSDELQEDIAFIKSLIEGFPIVSFTAKTNTSQEGIRSAMLNKLAEISDAITTVSYQDAINQLKTLSAKVDGESKPQDWIHETEAVLIHHLITELISNINSICSNCK